MLFENVKGVIWDLDGTLLDSLGVFEQVLANVVAESGYPMPTREHILNNYHGTLEEAVQKILGIESADELDDLISSFLEKQEHHYAGDLETHLFKDASMLAQRAAVKGIHQLLVTNRAHEGRGSTSPKFIIAATVLADCVHEVRAGDEVEYRKPDKRSAGNWMERHNLTPPEVVVIGDQFVDAQLALNIGARAVLVRRNGSIPHLDTLTHQDPQRIVTVDSLESVKLV